MIGKYMSPKFQVSLCITNNSIKHQSFVYTHLNDLTSISYNSIHHKSFIFKSFYMIY